MFSGMILLLVIKALFPLSLLCTDAMDFPGSDAIVVSLKRSGAKSFSSLICHLLILLAAVYAMSFLTRCSLLFQVLGMSPGDMRSVVIPCEDAFGLARASRVLNISREGDRPLLSQLSLPRDNIRCRCMRGCLCASTRNVGLTSLQKVSASCSLSSSRLPHASVVVPCNEAGSHAWAIDLLLRVRTGYWSSPIAWGCSRGANFVGYNRHAVRRRYVAGLPSAPSPED